MEPFGVAGWFSRIREGTVRIRAAPGSVNRADPTNELRWPSERNAYFDLARRQQLLKVALHPFDRHQLTGRRTARGYDNTLALHTQNGVSVDP